MSINKQIDKAQEEAVSLKSSGFVKYIWSRKLNVPIAVLLITAVVFSLLGAIAF